MISVADDDTPAPLQADAGSQHRHRRFRGFHRSVAQRSEGYQHTGRNFRNHDAARTGRGVVNHPGTAERELVGRSSPRHREIHRHSSNRRELIERNEEAGRRRWLFDCGCGNHTGPGDRATASTTGCAGSPDFSDPLRVIDERVAVVLIAGENQVVARTFGIVRRILLRARATAC